MVTGKTDTRRYPFFYDGLPSSSTLPYVCMIKENRPSENLSDGLLIKQFNLFIYSITVSSTAGALSNEVPKESNTGGGGSKVLRLRPAAFSVG